MTRSSLKPRTAAKVLGVILTVCSLYAYRSPPAIQRSNLVDLNVGAGVKSRATDLRNAVVASTARSAMQIQVGVTAVNPGDALERSSCLTIAIGSAAAAECGGLRIVHPLPAVSTFGSIRAPTLIYNSDFAAPFPVIAANVTLPVNVSPPDRVEATLFVEGAARSRGIWKGSSWPTAQAVRIALGYDASADPTSIYHYSLKVVAFRGALSDSGQATGTLAVVNRIRSSFGAGWWLAGLDQLVLDPSNEPGMWVGGDGSVRRYRKINSTAWVATSLDRPDTLVREGSGFARILSGGVKVVFDSAGRHIRTRNRVNRETVFAYDGQGRLQSISVSRADTIIPPNCTVLSDGSGVFCTAPVLGQLTWSFSYGASGLIRSVSSPGLGGSRTTTLVLDGRRVTSITDPDTTKPDFWFPGLGTNFATVTFSYANSVSNRIVARSDRRGHVTDYSFDRAGKVIYSRLDPGAGDTIVRRIRPLETLGLPDSLGAGAIDTAAAYTRLDGPRLDISDTTIVFLDNRSEPRRILDATSHETKLDRTDPRFPGLVTQLRTADSLVTLAQYDARGNDSVVTVVHPYGGDSSAVTRYLWDGKFDFVKQITLPNGEVTAFGYDSLGNRIYQQVGPDSLRRVRFKYVAGTDLVGSVRQPGAAAPDSMEYDRLGNAARQVTPLGFDRLIVHDSLGRVVNVRSQVAFDRNLSTRIYRNDSSVFDNADRVRHTESRGPALNGVPQQTILVWTNYDLEGNTRTVARAIDPDESGIGTITTAWNYDGANRAVVETAPDGMQDSTFYDAASNVLKLRTRRLDPSDASSHLTINLAYDVLNRLVQRITPAVHYRASTEGIPQADAAMLPGAPITHAYPAYPNDGADGFLISGDTARYAYDPMGRIDTANNAEARVARAYYPNGSLRTETLQVRSVNDTTFPHSYTLSYSYDLDARRRQLNHPTLLAPSPAQNTTNYSYDPITGDLASVQDPIGNQFRFHYNLRGELDTLYRPGSTTQSFTYDADGRTTGDTVVDPFAAGGKLRIASLEYDAANKLTFEGNGISPFDTLMSTFSGLGHVVKGKSNSYGSALNGNSANSISTDSIATDAMGNLLRRYNNLSYVTLAHSDAQHDTTGYAYSNGVGRLTSVATVHGQMQFVYDSAGDETFRTETSGHPNDQRDRHSYYDGAGRLRAADARSVSDYLNFMTPWSLVFEEYRYDALGRRVWVRARRSCANDPDHFEAECSLNKVRRTVWDGDQELYEIQMPGSDGSPYIETDVGLDSLPADNSIGNAFDPNPFFGRVSYTHGIGIDQPLGILRMNYGDRVGGGTANSAYQGFAPFSLVPIWNAQGQPQIGVFDDGHPSRCVTTAQGQRCVVAIWPGSWFAYTRPRFRTSFWHGTVLEDKQDFAGTHYRRNRNYDPQTGRFTQEDPIGLAGGTNLYGFAGGDPVDFSDPFGLCPPLQPCPVRPGMLMGALLNGLGQVAENPRVQNGALLIASTFAPEETAVGGGIRLYRAAKGAESAARLGKQAAEAEAAGFPHGISVTGNPGKFRNLEEAGPGATVGEIQQQFEVQATPTRSDPTHHTIVLPKPVTPADATRVNNLFREKPQP